MGEAYVEPFGKNGYIVKLTQGIGNHLHEMNWMFQLLVKGETVTGDQAKKYRDLALEIVDIYKKRIF
ncbi:hypothetical protein ACFVS2_26025 [Brevibacillus sp. NPDC058079]|uniref:hypothetical protein n=1 Tax=Brevibacillus sp. NPDC058079 TaxID=3346330 RepID=UPI0036E2881F